MKMLTGGSLRLGGKGSRLIGFMPRGVWQFVPWVLPVETPIEHQENAALKE
jgi:hypothetical protein